MKNYSDLPKVHISNFPQVVGSQLTSCSVIAIFLIQLVMSSLFTSLVFAESSLTETKIPIVLIPAITQNILTIVSFLIGTSSFVLGLRIQHISRSSSSSSPLWKIMNKYFDMLILALVIPAIVLIIFGIMILGSQIDPGDLAYLLLLFVLFIPAGAVLFLVSRLRILSKRPPE
jgi:hypothetical protein